ncbi:hypothetical protein A0256_23800 [Mucilaginibacter sp. PAMC 26640]|nr:hypothetical protein A0256_23800 [Mucilaginibacter sp. PAMC 26640]
MKRNLTITCAALLLYLTACKREDAVKPTVNNPLATTHVESLAVQITPLLVAGKAGSSGFTDGVGSAARFKSITGIFVDGDGTLYICDSGNQAVRRISIQNKVTTLNIAPEYFGEIEFSEAPFYVAVLNNGTVGISANKKLVLYKDGAVIKSFSNADNGIGLVGGLDEDPTGTFFYMTHTFFNLPANQITTYLGTIKKNQLSSSFTKISDEKSAYQLHTSSVGVKYLSSNGGLYTIGSTGLNRVYADLNTGVIHAYAVNKAGNTVYLTTGDNGDIKMIKNNQLTTIYNGAQANGIALANSEKYLYYTSGDNTVRRIPVPQ